MSSTELKGPTLDEVIALRTIFGEKNPLALIPLSIQKKIPIVLWKYITDRGFGWTVDEIRSRWRGRENVGIVMGEPSQWLWTVDCDGLDAAAYALENFPDTPIMQKTGSGEGLHLLYRSKPGEMTSNKADILGSKAKWAWEAEEAGYFIKPRIDDDMSDDEKDEEVARAAEHKRLARENIPLGVVIDIRGKGGQIAGPGSVHRSGRIYEMVEPWSEAMWNSAPIVTPDFLEDIEKWVRPEQRGERFYVPGNTDFRIRTDDEKFRRAAGWLRRKEGALSGANGHDHTFGVANVLVRGFDLGVEGAMTLILGTWNDICDPPWSAKDIQHKCDDAAQKEGSDGKPNGWMLEDRPDWIVKNAMKGEQKKTVEDIKPRDMIQAEYEAVDPSLAIDVDDSGKEVETPELEAALDLADEFEAAAEAEEEKKDEYKLKDLNEAERGFGKCLAQHGIAWDDLKQAGWTDARVDPIRQGDHVKYVFKPTVNNMVTVLLFSKMFKGKLAWDKLKICKLYEGRRFTDMDKSRILRLMEKVFLHKAISSDKLDHAVNQACELNTVDQIHDFYNGIDAWDGTDYFRKCIVETFGVDETDGKMPLYQRMLQNTLVGMVARIDNPGAKMDTVLILQGKQGYRKSTFFAELLPNGLSTDSQSFDFRKKDGLMLLTAHVAIEMGECVHIRSESAYESLKQFLSQRVDTFRPPYGRELIEVPRHCIFFASANDESLFYDPTGTRRFYVIPVARKMEYGETEQIRDGMLAQAKSIYLRWKKSQHGDEEFEATRWWFETDDDLESRRAEASRAYEDHHPWEERIMSHCVENAGKNISTHEILTKVIGKDLGQTHSGDQRIVSRIVRRLGCLPSTERIDGVRRRVWAVPDDLRPPLPQEAPEPPPQSWDPEDL